MLHYKHDSALYLHEHVLYTHVCMHTRMHAYVYACTHLIVVYAHGHVEVILAPTLTHQHRRMVPLEWHLCACVCVSTDEDMYEYKYAYEHM